MPVCTCTPAAQQLPHYMHTSAVKQLHACIHTCTPAAQQLTYYMHTAAVKQLHARTYMYPSCPAASILYAHLSCQTASCSYIHVPQLPSSFYIICTLQLSNSFMLVHTCTPAAQQLPYYMHTSPVKQLHACTYMYPSCPAAYILCAHFSCQAASCLYTYMYSLPSSSHIICTLQLSSSLVHVHTCTPAAQQLLTTMASHTCNCNAFCFPPSWPPQVLNLVIGKARSSFSEKPWIVQ